MDESQLRVLIAEDESERLDFKRELRLDTARAKAEFIKDVISLANSAPSVGYLIVGVDDAKLVVGTDEVPEEQIQSVCDTYTTPPVSIRCYSIPVSIPLFPLVGVIEIRARRRPLRVARALEHLNKEDVFVRHGSVVARASADEIIRMDEGWLRSVERNRKRLLIASSKLRLGNWRGAIEEYSKVIDAEPTAEVYLARGEAFEMAFWAQLKKGLSDQRAEFLTHAHEDYCLAVDIGDSEDIQRRARIRRLYLDQSSTEEWEADLAWLKSHSKGREYAEVIVLEQRVYYRRAHEVGNDAVEALSRAIELGCDSSEVYFLRAIGHLSQYNYGLALPDLDEAIHRLESGDTATLVEYLARKAEVLVSMERFGEAYDVLVQARKADVHETYQMTSVMWNQSRAYLLRCALQAGFEDPRDPYLSRQLKERGAAKVLALGLSPWDLKDVYRQCPALKSLVSDIVGDDFARLIEEDFSQYSVEIQARGLTERTEILREWIRLRI